MFKILIALILFPSIAFAQNASTVPIFGQDQCVLIETEDGTVANWACLPVKVPNGSLTDNGNGTFSFAPSGSGSGTVNSATAGQFAYYAANGTAVSGNSTLTFSTPNIGISSSTPGQKLDIQGTVRALGFSGPGTSLTGTAASLTAGTVTTNANLTGPITSVGNATAIASQTGSGSKFVVDNGPTLIAPVLGAATATSLTTSGNVGVNSASPGQRLDVQGTIRSSTDILIGAQSVCQANGTNCPGSITGFANPTGTIGLAAVNGSATTAMRSDGAPALSQAIAPTWTSNHIFSPSSGNTLISAGNLGIGSATPGNKLDVQGTVRTTGFTLNLAPLAGGNVLVSNALGIGTWMPPSTISSGSGAGTVTSSGSPVAGNISKFTSATDIAPAAAADIVTLFSGCSGTLYLGADGACHSAGGAASAAGGTNAVQYNSGSSTFAGSETIFSFNGTNVGIGTTSGTKLLDVRGTTITPAFQIDSYGNIGIGTTFNFTALSVMSGNVGIGTTVPLGQLHVGTGTAPGLVVSGPNVSIGTKTIGNGLVVGSTGQFSVSATGTVTTSSSVGFNASNAAGGFSGTSATAGSNTTFQGGSSTTSFGIIQATSSATSTTGSIRFRFGTTQEFARMQDNSGNWGVGIGTTSPAGVLDVQGTLRPIIFNGLNNSLNNIGIGSFRPGALLDVNGAIRSVTGGVVAKAACWCTTPPNVLGNCSSVVDVVGGCTCNYNGSGC